MNRTMESGVGIADTLDSVSTVANQETGPTLARAGCGSALSRGYPLNEFNRMPGVANRPLRPLRQWINKEKT